MGGDNLPVVRELPEQLTAPEISDRIRHFPRLIWLDSSSANQETPGDETLSANRSAEQRGRFSFLAADPIETIDVSVGDDNPWPKFSSLVRRLPNHDRLECSPFAGGIAGVIGYESLTWLEQVDAARNNDLPTPAMSLGVYDWTIAIDHQSNRQWLISQGLDVGEDIRKRRLRAEQRADEVLACLCSTPSPRFDDTAPDKSLDQKSLPNQRATPYQDVTSNFSSAEFQDAVAEIVERIRDGHSFQVNLAQRLLHPQICSPESLYLKLRQTNPAPQSGYYDGGDFHVLSSSPEGFLRVRDRMVETRPIKGTVPRTGDANRDRELAEQLLSSEKDRAENVMIVDLMRNDLSRVCDDESIRVEKLCQIERYQFVQHLVSVVMGKLTENNDAVDLLKACFPGGSITGAPKIEAMKTIAELEKYRRGPYCGSMGYVSCCGSADWNILIRTITAAAGQWQIPVGGGITARSIPIKEEAETWAKAEGMLRAIQAVG